MRTFLLLILLLCCAGTFAQFSNLRCTGGCVWGIAHWKAATTVWPSTYPESTPICGTNVSVILESYSPIDCGSVSPISVLGQYIWAKANEAYGACRRPNTRNALSTLQNAVATANTGLVVGSTPTAFVTGCVGGWQNLENLLKVGITYTGIAGTLCNFNNGISGGPCPCGPTGVATDCGTF